MIVPPSDRFCASVVSTEVPWALASEVICVSEPSSRLTPLKLGVVRRSR